MTLGSWPTNALIALGIFLTIDAALIWATWRFENKYVQPPEDPEVLAERAFADDVEQYLQDGRE